MQIRICIAWKVIIDSQINTFDINSPTENIGSDTDALVELLELLVAFDTADIRCDLTSFKNMTVHIPLFLAHAGVYSNARKVAFPQQFIQFCSSNGTFHEDDDLIKLQRIKQVTELSIFFPFAEFDIVLLKTMECKLGLIINVNLERILHELLADRTNIL